jgi:hypothetical protein
MFPDSSARRSHRIARILRNPTFFGWLKTRIERREYNGEDEFYEVVYEILTALSIETVFVDWVNRFQRLIDENSDYVS